MKTTPSKKTPTDSFVGHSDPGMRAWLTLQRAGLMLMFFILFEVLNYIIFGIAAVQMVVVAITTRPITPLHKINEGLSAYMGDISGYLTCVDKHPPFPFSRLRGKRADPLPKGWPPTTTPPSE